MATALRIALLTYSTRPRGGVVHTLALAEALAEIGHRVTVHSLGRSGDHAFFRPVDPRVQIAIAPLHDVAGESVGERVIRSIDALAGVVDTDDFDVVHAQDCISANAVSRCIRTVHHIDQFTTPELVACHERALVNPFRHVCVSSAVAVELRTGWGISAKVIPNGVDAARFSAAAGSAADTAAARAEWREEIGGPYVLTVGGIEPRKGSIDLIEAFAHSGLGCDGLRLVVAGGETLFDYRAYRSEFHRRAAELGIEPMILGPVADDRLPALVAGASCFAFPSVKEGFGMAAMEALAAGVPVVLRDLAVFHEIFAAAVTYGTTAEQLGARLAAAVRTPSPDLQALGRNLAAKHSWKRAAAAHVALYQEVIDSENGETLRVHGPDPTQ